MAYTFLLYTLNEKYAVDVRQIVFQFSNENFRDPLISPPYTYALISPRYRRRGELNKKGKAIMLEENLNLKEKTKKKRYFINLKKTL